jgi:tRNA(Ile)-lysidine synthase TilS/MesJ
MPESVGGWNDAEGTKCGYMVSITGGRDSTYLLYYAKHILGLNPVAFNFHTGFVSDVGQENMVNVTKALGIDFIQFRVDWQFLKKLARGFFINNGEVCSV